MPGGKRFSVYWASTGAADIQAIVDHIASDNPNAALRIFQQIKKAASKLVRFPYRGRIVPELKEQGILIYRELIRSPWRILYRIEGSRVWVLAVIDGRRNVEDLLLDRFLR